MTSRDRRAVVFGSVLMATAFLALRGIPHGIHMYRAVRERLADQVAMLERAQEVVGGLDATRDSVGRAAAALVALAPKLVGGKSPGEAGGSLAAVVSLAAQQHDLALVTVDPQPMVGQGLFAPVSVRAQLEGDVTGLARLLAEMETGEQVLSVRSLAVQRLEPAPGDGGAARLRIDLEVLGWRIERGTS